ncbi:SGNH/GDSL hydrolase family protein [Thioclava sp. GXIMD2076]|uniref:SGNH/GDSL hydrolase family protein n=1 Tax=Thioclava sp. GXIMD2076 TaxID=3131931 RepID=UPI0030CF457C
MAILDDINASLRDFNRYTGDGLPNEPVGAPLPVGDVTSGRYQIQLAPFRNALIAILQTMGDEDALQDILAQVTAAKDRANHTGTQAPETVVGLPEAIAGLADEVAERKSMIVQRDGSLVIKDQYGNVIMRLNELLLSLMGGTTLANFLSSELVVTDSDGFVIFRADPDVISHMGVPLGAVDASDILAAQYSAQNYRTWGDQPLKKIRHALASVMQKLGNARVACVGDSNTMGWQSGGVTIHRRALSYPAALSRFLAEYAGTDLNTFGRALTGTAGYEDYDPRVTLNGWLASGATSVGGEMWDGSTQTAPFEYLPESAWDTVDVWVGLSSAGEMTIGVDGDETTYTPAVGEVVKITYSAPSLAVQALKLGYTSGASAVIGWSCYDSSTPGVEVLNMGRSGWRSDQYADAASFYSPLNALAAVAPDLTLVQLGLNDFNQNRDPELFRADMQTIIDTASQYSDLVLIVPMHPSYARTYSWSSYVAVIEELAEQNSVPVVNITGRFGTWSEADAAGFMADGLHPNAYGYGDTAALVSQLLKGA